MLCQALFYLGAFYLTHTMPLVVILVTALQYYNRIHYPNMYPLWVSLVALAPLQGFWNSLVYFRPRINAALRSVSNNERSAI